MRSNLIFLIPILFIFLPDSSHAQDFGLSLVNYRQKKIYEEPNIGHSSSYKYYIYEETGFDSCIVKEYKIDVNKRKLILDSLKNAGFENNLKDSIITSKSKFEGKITKFKFYCLDSSKSSRDSVFIFDMEYTIKLKNPKIIRHFYQSNITTGFRKSTLAKYLKTYNDYTLRLYQGVNIYRLEINYDSLYYFVYQSEMSKVLSPTKSGDDFF